MSEGGGATLYFCDSSAIVKRYATELGSDWVDAICDDTKENIIAVSQIGLVEVCAALAAKHRAKAINTEEYERTLSDFIADANQHYLLVTIDSKIVDLAIDLTRRQKLRGCDAVHLASALVLNAKLVEQELAPLIFVAADDDLLKAARLEKLLIENPNEHSK
jgi:predicted nucleic acid-binding protein